MSELQCQNAIDTIRQLQTLLESEPAVTTDMREYTEHFFAPGIYFRVLFIPKGHVVVGAVHKNNLLNILLKGKISVVNSMGKKLLAEAPYIFETPPGQKAGYAVTDVWFANIFPNPEDIRDIKQLEDKHTAPSFEALEVTSCQ